MLSRVGQWGCEVVAAASSLPVRFGAVFCAGFTPFFAGFALVGCTHYLDRGTDLYHQGHYIDAAHVFQNSEERAAEGPEPERAAYAVYRGATLLHLGDLAGAEKWLRYAQGAELLLEPPERRVLRESLAAFHIQAARALQSDAARRRAPVVANPSNGKKAFAD
jgi:hypothetical protein